MIDGKKSALPLTNPTDYFPSLMQRVAAGLHSGRVTVWAALSACGTLPASLSASRGTPVARLSRRPFDRSLVANPPVGPEGL